MILNKKIHQSLDIHQQVEEISAYLQKAIIVEDKNFELVAYNAPNGFSFDPVQQKTILTKRCPLYVIERLKSAGVMERLKVDDRPIRLDRMEDILFYERVVISLKHDGCIYGYLWIHEAAQLSNEQLAFVSQMAPYLGKNLCKKQSHKGNDFQTFIWNVLNHEYLSETEMLQDAKRISFEIDGPYTVIVHSVKNAEYVHVLEKIRSYFAQQNIVYYLGKGTEIIGIAGTNKSENPDVQLTRILQGVKNQLDDKELSAIFTGVGETYNRIGQIRGSYVEALEVIETFVFLDADVQKTIYFRELGHYRYLRTIYRKNVGDGYRNSAIVKLVKRDAENNSELLSTLWHFLKNDCKVTQTANELFIHPNTMNYRIKQIVDITRFDFSNMQEKIEMYLQLQLIQHVPDYRGFYEQEIVHEPLSPSK